MDEFDKLVKMLDDARIPYERCDGIEIRRIHYPQNENFTCSAICGRGTYGNEKGLIEIMGLLTPEEEEMDSVVGHLTAKEVFGRILKDFSGMIMEAAGYNDHDGTFEKCPFCGEIYNSYDRIAMGLKNKEPFECRKCKQKIAFRP